MTYNRDTNQGDPDIRQFLRHVDQEELHRFIASYALKDPRIKKELFDHFHPERFQKGLREYRKNIQECFSFDPSSLMQRGNDLLNPGDEADDQIYPFLEKGKYLLSQGNVREAAAITRAILETIPRNYETVDDTGGSLRNTFEEALQTLKKVIVHDHSDHDLKEDIYQWYLGELREPSYEAYGLSWLGDLLDGFVGGGGENGQGI